MCLGLWTYEGVGQWSRALGISEKTQVSGRFRSRGSRVWQRDGDDCHTTSHLLVARTVNLASNVGNSPKLYCA